MRLFDAIDEQEEYEEHLIKKKFQGEVFIRHLPSEKSYLFGMILESLNAFYKEKNFLTCSAASIISAEILYDKGLFGMSLKLLKKAKKNAILLEKFPILLLILRMETLIYIKDEDGKKLRKSIREERKVLRRFRVYSRIMQVAFDIQVYAQEDGLSSLEIEKFEEKIRKFYPPQVSDNSFWAQYYYYSSIALLDTFRHNAKGRMQSYHAIKNLMESSPQFITEVPLIYLINYNNLVNVMFYLKEYEEAGNLIYRQKILVDQYKIENKIFSERVFLNTSESELYLCYKTNRVQDGLQLVKKIEERVFEMKQETGPILMDLCFFMAVCSFLGKDFKRTTFWLNKILRTDKTMQIRMELLIHARLLYLLMLHASGDLLFYNRLQATRRFISLQKGYLIQKKILEAIQIMKDDLELPKGKNKLSKILDSIGKLEAVSGEEMLNKNFKFQGWIANTFKVSP